MCQKWPRGLDYPGPATQPIDPSSHSRVRVPSLLPSLPAYCRGGLLILFLSPLPFCFNLRISCDQATHGRFVKDTDVIQDGVRFWVYQTQARLVSTS